MDGKRMDGRLLAVGVLHSAKTGSWVEVDVAFRLGLKFLDRFSHVWVFFQAGGALELAVTGIVRVDVKGGLVCLAERVGREGATVYDLKPYFPCEDRVRKASAARKGAEGRLQVGLSAEGGLAEIGCVRKREGRVWLELDDGKAWQGLDGASHVRVLWWFHRFDKVSFRRTTLCRPPYAGAPRTGVFASRSPVRPNPVAMTVARILSREAEGGRVEVSDLDAFDGTPVVGVLPVRPERDRLEGCRVPEWLSGWPEWLADGERKAGALPRLPEGAERPEGTAGATAEERRKAAAYFARGEGGGSSAERGVVLVEGARENNLKNVTVRIPKRKITMVTGVSGSGKSSLVFDTVYAEGRRRLAEGPGGGAGVTRGPEVERIAGLPLTVAAGQVPAGRNPRSTVGTLTGLYDALRRLYAAAGTRHCPECGAAAERGATACAGCGGLYFDVTPALFSFNDPESMCPVCKGLGERLEVEEDLVVGHPEKSLLDGASAYWGDLRRFARRPNANWMKGEVLALAAEQKVDLEQPWKALPEEFRREALQGSGGREVSFRYETDRGRRGEIRRAVEGAVPVLRRLLAESGGGETLASAFARRKICGACNGERLGAAGRLFTLAGVRFPVAARLELGALRAWVEALPARLSAAERAAGGEALRRARWGLRRLAEANVDYLALDRSVPTLSGGEWQRLRLASLPAGMADMLLVLDEPSAGLHPADAERVAGCMRRWRDEGNTVLAVEHNADLMARADWLIDMGPGAGEAGGRVVAEGTPRQLAARKDSPTGRYLARRAAAARKRSTDVARRTPTGFLTLNNARLNNLQNLTVRFPLGVMCCVTGVSGSGKSSLVAGTLYPALRDGTAPACNGLEGREAVGEVIRVTQQPIGRTSRSNPATYTGLFDQIRTAFAAAPDGGGNVARFSFNSREGACPACGGEGRRAVDAVHMPGLFVDCSLCGGLRYRPESLAVRLNGKNIAEVLAMSVSEARSFFRALPGVAAILETLEEVGLGYLRLGQPAPSLSGGEAQRVKLAAELHRMAGAGALYLLDEPSAGLHGEDVQRLLALMHRLVARGASVVSVEHHLDWMAASDWIIDLGPGGGREGGRLVVEGTPEAVAACEGSLTGRALRTII